MDEVGHVSRKKIIILVLSILLVIGLIAAALLYRQAKLQESLQKNTPSNTNTQSVSNEPLKQFLITDPIKKLVNQSDGGVEYKLKGTFTTKPELNENIIFVNFHLMNSPKNSEILVRMGSLDGKINFGKCGDDICSSGNWKFVDTKDVITQIQLNKNYFISVDFPSNPDPDQQHQKQILDKYIDDVHAGTQAVWFSPNDSLYVLGLSELTQ